MKYRRDNKLNINIRDRIRRGDRVFDVMGIENTIPISPKTLKKKTSTFSSEVRILFQNKYVLKCIKPQRSCFSYWLVCFANSLNGQNSNLLQKEADHFFFSVFNSFYQMKRIFKFNTYFWCFYG